MERVSESALTSTPTGRNPPVRSAEV